MKLGTDGLARFEQEVRRHIPAVLRHPRLPIEFILSTDPADDALHLAGSSKGYVGGSIGLSQNRDDKLRSAIRYELRRNDKSQQLFTAGIVGRLTNATAGGSSVPSW